MLPTTVASASSTNVPTAAASGVSSSFKLPLGALQSLTDQYRQEICLLSSLTEYHHNKKKNNNNNKNNGIQQQQETRSTQQLQNYSEKSLTKNNSDKKIAVEDNILSSTSIIESSSKPSSLLQIDNCKSNKKKKRKKLDNNHTDNLTNDCTPVSTTAINDKKQFCIPSKSTPTSTSTSTSTSIPIPIIVSQNILLRSSHQRFVPSTCVSNAITEVERIYTTDSCKTVLSPLNTTVSNNDANRNNPTNTTNSSDTTNCNNTTFIPICYQCGGILQPGLLGCTVRIHSNNSKQKKVDQSSSFQQSTNNIEATNNNKNDSSVSSNSDNNIVNTNNHDNKITTSFSSIDKRIDSLVHPSTKPATTTSKGCIGIEKTTSKKKKSNRSARRRKSRLKGKFINQIEEESHMVQKQNSILCKQLQQHILDKSVAAKGSSNEKTTPCSRKLNDINVMNLLSFCQSPLSLVSSISNKNDSTSKQQQQQQQQTEYDKTQKRLHNQLLYKNHIIITCGVCSAQRTIEGVRTFSPSPQTTTATATNQTIKQSTSSLLYGSAVKNKNKNDVDKNNKRKSSSFYHLLSNGKNEKSKKQKRQQQQHLKPSTTDHNPVSSVTNSCTAQTPIQMKEDKSGDAVCIENTAMKRSIHFENVATISTPSSTTRENATSSATPSQSNIPLSTANTSGTSTTTTTTPNHRKIGTKNNNSNSTPTIGYSFRTPSLSDKNCLNQKNQSNTGSTTVGRTTTTPLSIPSSTRLSLLSTTNKKNKKTKDPLKDFLMTLNDR